MNETILPRLSKEIKEQIKKIVKYHYGFDPKESDIERIDNALRNNYIALHDQQIIRELVSDNAAEELLKHKDRLGLEFDRIWLEKSIFKYLMYASMCFKGGIKIGTIILCRTALESGLRERLAEEYAKNEIKNDFELPEATWLKLKELTEKTLGQLIKEADKENIISEQEIESLFKDLKYKEQSSKKILDKFIHGDIVWLVDYVKDKEADTRVIGAKDVLQERKIISDIMTDEIAFKVLKTTYKIAEIIYLNNYRSVRF